MCLRAHKFYLEVFLYILQIFKFCTYVQLSPIFHGITLESEAVKRTGV